MVFRILLNTSCTIICATTAALPFFFDDDDDDAFSFLCSCSWCNSTLETLAGTWNNSKYFCYLRCLGKASTSKAANFSLVVLCVMFLFELCFFCVRC